MPDDVHVRGADGRNLCDVDGPSITHDEALDPDDGKVFTCGDCLAEINGGAHPAMGASAPGGES